MLERFAIQTPFASNELLPRDWQGRARLRSLDFDCDDSFLGFAQKKIEHSYDLPRSFETFAAKRQSEFMAGRLCALEALTALSSHMNQKFELGISHTGAPSWPDGFLGSISHTKNKVSSRYLAAALVLEKSLFSANFSMGLDIESVIESEKATKLIERISLPNESSFLLSKNISLSMVGTLLFSAKEAVYKSMNESLQKIFSFKSLELKEVSMASHLSEEKVAGSLQFSFKNESQPHAVTHPFTVNFVFKENLIWCLAYTGGTNTMLKVHKPVPAGQPPH